MNNPSSLEIKQFIQILSEKRKSLFILILLTAIVSTIISFLIPPKYKTIAVVYPTHLSPYSEESQTEQLLQYLKSVIVRDAVIKKMNLLQHYKIDTTKPEWKSKLYDTYRKNISFSPTLYESIEIEVKDRNPQKTKEIAECIIQITDSVILSLKQKIIMAEYRNFQSEINRIQQRIDSLNQLILSIKNQYHILDADNQSKYLSKRLSTGKIDAESQKLVEALKNKKEYLHVLQRQVAVHLKSMEKLKIKQDKLEADLKGSLQFTQVVSPPYVPDKKYFPVRWLIIALSELSVITIFIIYLLLTQKPKQ